MTRRILFRLTFLIVFLIDQELFCDGKVYGKCELARELLILGVPKCQISTWVCIANYESHFDTSARNLQTGDHGIFQISEIYWCSNSNMPGGGCNARCSDFRTADISAGVRCIQIIYNDWRGRGNNGFDPWTTYRSYCAGHNAQWVNGCPGFHDEM